MTNIIDDLSLLTTIPEKTITKLLKKEIYCICEAIEEDVLEGKDLSILNLGFGVLYIKHTENEVKYKFVPTNELQKAITNTIVNKKNILEDVLNASLAAKFMEVYKDLC